MRGRISSRAGRGGLTDEKWMRTSMMVRWSFLIHCEYLSCASPSLAKSSSSSFSFGSFAYLFIFVKEGTGEGK